MKLVSLPALLSDEKTPSVIEITNKKVDKAGKKFEIPAESFEFQEAESLDEAASLCGGSDKLLNIFNEKLRDDAVAEGKNKIRMATSGTEEDIVRAGLEACRTFTFLDSQRITASEAKEKYSQLRAIASEQKLDDAALAAKVREMFNL